MDAMEHSNDFKPIDYEGNEVESSHLLLDCIPSTAQSKVVESTHLHLDHASNLDPQSKVVESTHLHLDHASNSVPQSEVVESTHLHLDHVSNSVSQSEVVESTHLHLDHASNSDSQSEVAESTQLHLDDPQVTYVGPWSFNSNNPFTYNGVTYYSYKAFEQDFYKQLFREMLMEIDGVAPRSDDGNEPPFSADMVVATGGSPAVINPHNGLPWRKGSNLCRPYMDEGCCRFGTACIFHHPWPPTEELP